MDAHEDTEFTKECTEWISECQYKCDAFMTFTLADKLRDLCCGYKKSSFVLKRLEKLFEDDSFDLEIMERFRYRCGQDLSRWVTPDEATIKNIETPGTSKRLKRQEDALMLYLDFSKAVKRIMLEKRFETDFRFEPTVNFNLRTVHTLANIPILLRYGLKLEFTDRLYDRLKVDVLAYVLSSTRISLGFDTMSHYLSKRRVLLVLLMLWTPASYFPRLSDFRANALQTSASRALWRSIPDPHLCWREISMYFEGVGPDLDRMRQSIGQYEQRMECEGDIAEVVRPRSLSHLSRCKIREVMATNRQLPHGVQDLALKEENGSTIPIPELLKKYILLES